jgi:hypothetical protein
MCLHVLSHSLTLLREKLTFNIQIIISQCWDIHITVLAVEEYMTYMYVGWHVVTILIWKIWYANTIVNSRKHMCNAETKKKGLAVIQKSAWSKWPKLLFVLTTPTGNSRSPLSYTFFWREKHMHMYSVARFFLVQCTKNGGGGGIHRMTTNYVIELLQNIPNGRKIFYTARKYTNLFLSKAVQNIPKLEFLVWK